MATRTAPTDSETMAFLMSYDVGVRRSLRGIEAGTVNSSYALELDSNRTLFLRIYEEQGPAGAEAEAGLLAHLAASGVPTPPPIAGRDGRSVRLLAGKPAALFPWVRGDMLCSPSVTPGAARLVGEALAAVHRAGPAPAPAPRLSAGRFGADDLVARCDRIAKGADTEARPLAEALRDAVIRFDRRRRIDLPRGLVHGDLFRDNVLWHGGTISALLDFESAHDGPWIYDIAVALLSWTYREGFDFDIARALLDGYRGVRPLESQEVVGLYAEMVFATLRFTVTRITDDAARVGKRWQRFVARREALEQLGSDGLLEALGL